MLKNLFFILIAAIVGLFIAVDISIHHEMNRQIDTSLMTLNKQDLSLSDSKKGLRILPTNKAIRALQIDKMLRQTGDVSGSFTFLDVDAGTYTMSAQGLDELQHLVYDYLEGYQPFAVENVALPLYILSQRKSYMLDSKQYSGREEVWQSSRQAFYYPRGDCEDHALVLADWLIEMGEDARVVVGDMDGEGHAWVVLFKDGKEYLLEATQKSGLSRSKPYPMALFYTDYHPQYMFNRDYFWENTGSKFTTHYSNKKWQKKSRYSLLPFNSLIKSVGGA